ncbi:MAG: acyltransferase [Desulforegulaceae bacterium]|nr:acyltransferase [Desulforegulaceae bacterium]
MKRLCLQENVKIIGKEFFTHGDHVHIGANTEIQAEGGVSIGNNVVISYNCVIWTVNHNFEGNIIPYNFERHKRPVIIGDNVWIGRNVIINSGVKIGEGAVIGIGSVVTQNIPPLAIVGGNPTKIIKFRSLKKYLYLKNSNEFLSNKGESCVFCKGGNAEQFVLVPYPRKKHSFFYKLFKPIILKIQLIRIKLAGFEF